MRTKLFLALALTLLLLPRFAAAQQVSVGVVVPGVQVNIPPPAVRVEMQPMRPSAGHVWIAGHWAWRGGGHVWVPGHWSMPPQAGYTWEQARWVNEGGRYTFYEGHWRWGGGGQWAPQPAVEVETEQAPPAPIVETRPVAPQAALPACDVRRHGFHARPRRRRR